MLSDVICIERAIDLCGDMEFLKEMIMEFEKDLEKCMVLLKEAHVNKDAKSMRITSHRIKGQALNISCTTISNTSTIMEKSSSNGSYTEEEYENLILSIEEFHAHVK